MTEQDRNADVMESPGQAAACAPVNGSLHPVDTAQNQGKEQEPLFTGRRFRLYPTCDQAQILAQWIGCARVAYNVKVQAMEDALAGGEQFKADMTYSYIRSEDKLWLNEVPPEILRNAVYRFKQAAARWQKKLARQPTFHKKWKHDSIWLTSELFRFEAIGQDKGGQTIYRLIIGKPGYMIGEVAFHAHRDFVPPASITITRTASAFFLSFCNELPPEEMELIRTPEELLYEFQNLSEDELRRISRGNDRGIVRPFQLSDGQWEDLEEVQKARMAKKEKQRKRWQRRAARRKDGSKRKRKAQRKVAQTYIYGGNVRKDFSHKLAYRLIDQSPVRLLFTEGLHLKNMMRRPKAKMGPNGKWQKNGAAAKAGLNRALANIGLRQIITIVRQHARRKSKLVLAVPCQHSSNECSRCHPIDPASRKSQSEFACTHCGLEMNADENAALVIQYRGIQLLRQGKIKLPERKKIGFRKKRAPDQSAGGGAAPGCTAATDGTAESDAQGETVRRKGAAAARTQGSTNCEEAPPKCTAEPCA